MNISRRNKINAIFNIFCAIVVAFMMSYWLYKYEIEDRDITVVDYAQIEEAKNIKLPVATVCLNNAFNEGKLRSYNSNISIKSYLDYLKGEYFDEKLENIDYRDVTLKLKDYFLSAVDKYRNETSYFSKSSIRFEHREIWRGFPAISFFRCFVLTDDMDKYRYVESMIITYDLAKLFADSRTKSFLSIYVIFHYPGQLFISRNIQVVKLYPFDKKMHIYNHFILQVESFEVLKRRHTRSKNCLENKHSYDKIIVDEHLKNIGCRLPFHKEHSSIPLCKNGSKIEREVPESISISEKNQTRLDGGNKVLNIEKLNVPMSCERISQINVFQKGIRNENNKLSKTFSLQLSYPKEVKIISQSKEVDIHALIGNIGAYLGLFMGNY